MFSNTRPSLFLLYCFSDAKPLLSALANFIFQVAGLISLLPESSVAMWALEWPCLEVDSDVIFDVTELVVLDSTFSALQQLVHTSSFWVDHLVFDYQIKQIVNILALSLSFLLGRTFNGRA